MAGFFDIARGMLPVLTSTTQTLRGGGDHVSGDFGKALEIGNMVVSVMDELLPLIEVEAGSGDMSILTRRRDELRNAIDARSEAEEGKLKGQPLPNA